MTLKCGIVGLPNVGKSTLFNALTSTAAAMAANYPFCTIEPNEAIVEVPDPRLMQLAQLVGSAKVIPASLSLVDIAGLVKGASRGEGLGNKFLAHIREVDAIIHVLRCFEDQDITHVHGKIEPLYDADVINHELMLADLESVEKRLNNAQKRLKGGDKSISDLILMLSKALELLEKGERAAGLYQFYDKKMVDSLQLLTTKPVLYVCNVLEDDAASGNKLTEEVNNSLGKENKPIIISSKIEADIALLESQEERQEYLASLGLNETGLSKILKAAYDLLNLKSFFTIGPKEARAWTFEQNTKAPAAAGIIHTDFEKGFIRAEIIAFTDYIELGSENRVKEKGKMRLEGKDYQMQDGDVVHFRFNV